MDIHSRTWGGVFLSNSNLKMYRKYCNLNCSMSPLGREEYCMEQCVVFQHHCQPYFKRIIEDWKVWTGSAWKHAHITLVEIYYERVSTTIFLLKGRCQLPKKCVCYAMLNYLGCLNMPRKNAALYYLGI